MPKATGSVRFAGTDLLPRFRLGLAYVPEEKRIVPGLTVRENLQLGAIAGAARRHGSSSLLKNLRNVVFGFLFAHGNARIWLSLVAFYGAVSGLQAHFLDAGQTPCVMPQ